MISISKLTLSLLNPPHNSDSDMGDSSSGPRSLVDSDELEWLQHRAMVGAWYQNHRSCAFTEFNVPGRLDMLLDDLLFGREHAAAGCLGGEVITAGSTNPQQDPHSAPYTPHYW